MTWAQRFKRVFPIDIDNPAGPPICTVADCRGAVGHKDAPGETCEDCGGAVRIIASIRLQGCRRWSDAAGQSREGPAVIEKILYDLDATGLAALDRIATAPLGG